MDKLQINKLDHSQYIAIITVLDYEILLSKYLKEITFEPFQDNTRQVLVDLALLSGIDQFRFVEFFVDNSGNILLDNYNYVKLNTYLENMANNYLKERKEIVLHSILTDSQRQHILKQT